MPETTLILCSSMPEALFYAREAINRGERIVASSSLAYDESAKLYPVWEFLPSVYEEQFPAALQTLIARHHITRIYCPNNFAHFTLLRLREAGELQLPLIGMPPLLEQTEATKRLMNEAREVAEFIKQWNGRDTLADFRIATILRQAELTYGESHPSKLIAMMAIFADLPPGDVVEIGCFLGKTAVVLTMLAQHFKIGAVLCVDPWSRQESVQKDSPALVRAMPGSDDWEMLFIGFIANVAAVAEAGRFNYLRQPSVEAEVIYRDKTPIASAEFGSVPYSGRLALIHIDGNHDYASVKADYEAWRPHMQPGGWVVLDDYCWLHGDGPKRLGDEVLAAEKQNIAHSFVAGKALFLQIAQDVPALLQRDDEGRGEDHMAVRAN